MSYSGSAAIDYLAAEAGRNDSGASSHWRKYHSSFRYTGQGFEGLQGFGGSAKPHRGIRRALHRMLQRRFRRLGARYPQFDVIDNLANALVRSQQRAYDLDVLRQSITLAFLRHQVPEVTSSDATVCVIGDGFASMTALLLASGSAKRVVLVNLTRTLLVDLWYLKLWLGEDAFSYRVDLATDEGGLTKAFSRTPDNEENGRIIAIQASSHELLKSCPIDLAVNIASMQEMDPPVVAAYFEDLRAIAKRRRLIFYCCNREKKILPDSTVTCFAEYPWRSEDRIIVDELCPWHQQYYALRPPFYRPYDGPIRHRLVEVG